MCRQNIHLNTCVRYINHPVSFHGKRTVPGAVDPSFVRQNDFDFPVLKRIFFIIDNDTVILGTATGLAVFIFIIPVFGNMYVDTYVGITIYRIVNINTDFLLPVHLQFCVQPQISRYQEHKPCQKRNPVCNFGFFRLHIPHISDNFSEIYAYLQIIINYSPLINPFSQTFKQFMNLPIPLHFTLLKQLFPSAVGFLLKCLYQILVLGCEKVFKTSLFFQEILQGKFVFGLVI